mmetsp:Transcript_5575/g.5764  ORF Transcript_5575/g.5764 Transcript_5575/m.5764 type:complete len:123 (+) Transcript_5575:145-513(+)
MDPKKFPQLTLENSHVTVDSSNLVKDKNLMYFYGESCPFTRRAEPHVQCLENNIGRRLQRFEVYGSKENQELYAKLGGIENCGGVPYFYNLETGESICGLSQCAALIDWATTISGQTKNKRM